MASDGSRAAVSRVHPGLSFRRIRAAARTRLAHADKRRPMIIENQKDVTIAVLSELQRAHDPRFKQIIAACVRHLHDFVRDRRLTEEEFHAAMAYVITIGKHSNDSHNEAVLMAGSLGPSALICLLNHGKQGTTETDHNILGPFWRMHSTVTPNGRSVVGPPPPG